MGKFIGIEEFYAIVEVSLKNYRNNRHVSFK